MRTLSILTLGLLACGSGSQVDPTLAHSGPVSDSVTLVYQSRVDGEIEPCG